MKLRTQLNTIIILIFLIVLFFFAIISYTMEHKQATEEVQQTAKLILEMAFAIRQYTFEEVGPLLKAYVKDKSLPQTIPSYAAIYTFERLKKKVSNYTYKESMLNPKNPLHKASGWEVEIINTFRENKNLNVLIGNRRTRQSDFMYLAKPLIIEDRACLNCHGELSKAPKDIVEQYSTNGFGWKLNEVLGARIISVPSSLAHQKAQKSVLTLLISISCVFALIIVTINLILKKSVVKPIMSLSVIAEQISLGKKRTDAFPKIKILEFKRLMESIQRLKISRDHTLKALNEYSKQNDDIQLKMEDLMSEPEF